MSVVQVRYTAIRFLYTIWRATIWGHTPRTSTLTALRVNYSTKVPKVLDTVVGFQAVAKSRRGGLEFRLPLCRHPFVSPKDQCKMPKCPYTSWPARPIRTWPAPVRLLAFSIIVRNIAGRRQQRRVTKRPASLLPNHSLIHRQLSLKASSVCRSYPSSRQRTRRKIYEETPVFAFVVQFWEIRWRHATIRRMLRQPSQYRAVSDLSIGWVCCGLNVTYNNSEHTVWIYCLNIMSDFLL